MRELIQSLNKATLAAATGISYSRLRKYASGILSSLTIDEMQLIKDYLANTAKLFEQEFNLCQKNGKQ